MVSLAVIVVFHGMMLVLLAVMPLLAIAEHRVRMDEGLADILIGAYVVITFCWAVLLLYMARSWRKRGEDLSSLTLLGRWLLLSVPVYGVIRFKKKWYPLL